MATVVIAALLPAALSALAALVIPAAGGAAIATGLSGGNLGQILRSAAIAGATAVAFFGVGEMTNAVAGYTPGVGQPLHIQPDFGTDEYAFNVAGHALVGCGSSVASGGSCGSGALAGAAGAAAGPVLQGQGFGVKLVANATLGGLASVAGGGKFANGAITGAFGYLFNACAAGGCATGTSGYLPGFPDSLQNSISRVGEMVYASGNTDWEQRFDGWKVTYDNNMQGVVFGSTNYDTQATSFYKDITRLNQGEVDFVVAHEFGHLLPENRALAPNTFGDAFRNPFGDPAVERNADATARSILRLQVNPGVFESRR